MNKISLKNNRGFTMVETLVAIAILMVSIVGPLTISQKAYNAGIYARDQVTASYLAQDAVEFIKNIRDNNKLASPPRDWLYGLTNTCIVDTLFGDPSGLSSNYVSSCNSGGGADACRLFIGDNGYTHSPSGTTPTKYIRYFYITKTVDKEATLTVVVKWTTGIDNMIVYESRIFDIVK